MTNCQLLDDERLLDLLFTEEDRLPRAALAGLICVEFYWTGDSSKEWIRGGNKKMKQNEAIISSQKGGRK